MFRTPLVLAATLAVVVAATSVLAASHGGNPAVKARQAQMQLHQFNLGVLFGMARGNIDYDAATAQAAASNLALLSKIDETRYWEPGTDNASIDGTRALPAIWENIPDVLSKVQNFQDTAAALDAAAGQGLEAMQAALGPVGQACGACHEAYRQPNN